MKIEIIKETLHNKYIGDYQSYGFSIIKNNGQIELFHDITCNKNEIKKLYNILKRSNISEIHIKDIISDFIAKSATTFLLK